MAYQKLKRLGSEAIVKILNAANENVYPNYFTNVSTVNELLYDYKGPYNVNSIIKHIETQNALKEIDSLMNIEIPQSRTQIPHEQRYERYQASTMEAKKQIDTALNTIAHLNDPETDRRIEFNIAALDSRNRHYFNEHIGEVLLKLIQSITYSQSWLCYYRFTGMNDQVKMKILYDGSAAQILHQIRTENFISEAEAENAGIIEENYDFFPGQIRNLATLQFFDLMQYKDSSMNDLKANRFIRRREEEANDTVLQTLRQSGASKEVIDAYLATKKQAKKNTSKKQYKTIEGSFWKYTLKIPLNLERYQIFNELTKDTVTKMTSNNCLIWACIQAGVDDNTISHMKEIIRVRTFPQSKLQSVADETGIKFIVSVRYIDENFERTTTSPKLYTYTPKGDIKYTVNLMLMDGHYMLNENVPISVFFIDHYNDIVSHHPDWTIDRMQLVREYDATRDRYKIKNNTSTDLGKLLRALFKNGFFEPITIGDVTTYSSLIYKEKIPKLTHLEYDEKRCCRLKEDPKANPKPTKKGGNNSLKRFTREHVVYADFECSTDGIHKAFNICYESVDGSLKGSFWGSDCAIKFLEVLENNTLVYYHNLSYDINFVVKHLTAVTATPIIKGSRTMMLAGKYGSKLLCFKDSYAIISKPLKMFPVMFKLQTGAKEIFPYTYYSSSMLANDNKVGNILDAAAHTKDPEGFINNVNTVKGCKLSDTEFDMEVYSNYYCMQDVNILKQGFERFRNDLLKEFNLDAYDYVSISSIANAYFEHNVYWKNGNLYDLANTPREFISRCVQGGRCMLADNEKQRNSKVESGQYVGDFDAVSLYPAALSRLYVVEGKPKVLTPEMCDAKYLLEHLFEDDQSEPTEQRFISAFYVDAVITRIGKPRHMPLIVVNPLYNEGMDVPRSSNTCCMMPMNHITLQDLIEFQDCDIKVLRGYYFDGKRDLRIREEVQKLFQLRLKYKKEDNPLQEVIKLILNSIYGKTILKPIETKIKIVPNDDAMRFIRKNYNSITDIEPLYNSDFTLFKCLKPIVNHFNFCTLGVDILAMSKRIMNEVFCTAEDNNIKIFYQDTDSGHFYHDDLLKLAELFKQKYGRELIGKSLGQFHSDFAEVVKGYESLATESVFVGKKTYIDQLVTINEPSNDKHIAFHCRMKGVKQDVITITANEMFPNAVQCHYDESKGLHVPSEDYDENSKFSVMELYKALYNGQAISFDLCKGSNPCFERKNNFSIQTKTSFIRNLKF